MAARFGVAAIDGEDEEEGNLWFQIGLIEIDGEGENAVEIVPDELAVVMLRDAERMERKYPGITDKQTRLANIIATALTEYAANHDLDDDYFRGFA